MAVSGTIDAPQIAERRRIVLADPQSDSAKFPYHAAAELPLAEAEAFVRSALHSSRALALEEISAALKALESRGYESVGCGILLGSGKSLPGLDAILASHALIHTAEGAMYRDVLVWAAQTLRLRVTTLREKELAPESLKRAERLGRLIGPPWTLDQKYATVAALTALGEETSPLQ